MRDQDNTGIGWDYLIFKLSAQARGHHRIVQVRVDVDDEVARVTFDAEAISCLSQPLEHMSRRLHSFPNGASTILVGFGTFLLYHFWLLI